MKRQILISTLGLTSLLAWGTTPAAENLGRPDLVRVEPPPSARPKPLAQIALLLDTSGSMEGLLDQAKTQLWKVVNQMAYAKRHGQRPELQVALYEYGKQSISASEGFLRQIVPLTTDLDKVSEELFALKTNGGDEFCGRVIRAATEGLAWSASNSDLKAIFICGNEPFTQGKVDYHESCKAAIARGIVVHTIFCGDHAQGIAMKWEDGAQLADGSYMNIDQNRAEPQIAAPQDAELQALSGKLNGTYLAFGRRGAESLKRQQAQDGNAASAAPAAAAERAESKSSGLYKATDWDLVDAVAEKKVAVDKMEAAEMPAEMAKMSVEEREKYVAEKASERKEIQNKIQALSEERKKFVAEEMKKRAQPGEHSLDSALIKAIRTQAEKKEFTFE